MYTEKITVIAVSAFLIVCVLATCSGSPAYADLSSAPNEDGTLTIKLDREQAKECQAMGGCIVIPRDVLKEAINRHTAQVCAGKRV